MKRIVLVRTRGPRNVGSVLRVAANFGPAELLLVRPARRSLLVHPDLRQMAHGVEEVAARVRVVDSLAAALADATASYGFTARPRDHRTLHDWREIRDEIVLRAQDESETTALVFGSEENGLTGEEADLLHELVRLPTRDEHTSINLAMTVGIVLSTIFFAAAPNARAEDRRPLPGSHRDFLVAHLRHALGPLTTSAPARRDLDASIVRVFSRAPLERRDARAWHLLARAVGSEMEPADFGLRRPSRARRPKGRPPELDP
ncbi:MAG: TrmH family RNA methyltransferase [Planctomycetota bacterium]